VPGGFFAQLRTSASAISAAVSTRWVSSVGGPGVLRISAGLIVVNRSQLGLPT
jgi:hypothetical protein